MSSGKQDLGQIALKFATDGAFKTLPTPRKIQIFFGGVYVVQSTSAVYVWEHPYFPQLWIPTSEIIERSKQGDFTFEESEKFHDKDGKPVVTNYHLSVKGTDSATTRILAFSPSELTGKAAELAGLTRIEFDSMDQWLEEDTPIHVHPKDPFKRVDVLQSSRRITVKVDGRVIADTPTSMHLYETMLPCRYYLPLTSVDVKTLIPSKTRTKCPYKGEAEYFHVRVGEQTHEDLFWYYTNPTLECGRIAGLLCPYNERVDIEVDGKLVPRPKTNFGPPKENKKPPVV